MARGHVGASLSAELRPEIGGDGATLVLDCVATDATLELAAAVVAPGGVVSYVGSRRGALSRWRSARCRPSAL